MNSNLPLSSPYSQIDKITQTLESRGIKVNIDKESNKGVIDANGRKFAVSLINVNSDHPLDADTMTQIATRVAYMIFAKNLISEEFQGAKIDQQGIQINDKNMTHEEANTKELYQDIQSIMQNKLSKQNADIAEAQIGVNTYTKQPIQKEFTPPPHPYLSQFTSDQLDAINKYGANKVMVGGQFSQSKLDALQQAEVKAAAKGKVKTAKKEGVTRKNGFIEAIKTKVKTIKKDKSKLHTISNQKLQEKLTKIQFTLSDYAKNLLLLEQAREDLDKMLNHGASKGEIDATKATISSREKIFKEQLKELQSAKNELASFKLEKNKPLLNEIRRIIYDMQNLLNASNTKTASHAFLEKYKTKQEVQQGIGNAYTAAWSEKYAFRNPENPGSLINGHNNLIARDPANKNSYENLVSILGEVHQALQEASTTFGPLFIREAGLMNASHKIKPDTTKTLAISAAQKKLFDKLEELKQKAKSLTFETNSQNELQGVGNFGEYSKLTLDITLSKIQKELQEFDALPLPAAKI
ncbi:hypothetical protein [Candidatus Protochlamydia sp. W-9]|uniref:hypothetical protein n=1 Tax=Candidatus Protochlamydia sp. W-9 TaxID=1785087 RepID=UPI00096A626A|nr:hypothetical protein [Candidatus Protochlamydia sp. W-9]